METTTSWTTQDAIEHLIDLAKSKDTMHQARFGPRNHGWACGLAHAVSILTGEKYIEPVVTGPYASELAIKPGMGEVALELLAAYSACDHSEFTGKAAEVHQKVMKLIETWAINTHQEHIRSMIYKTGTKTTVVTTAGVTTVQNLNDLLAIEPIREALDRIGDAFEGFVVRCDADGSTMLCARAGIALVPIAAINDPDENFKFKRVPA